MKFSILASGSKGNCSVIESANTRLIIDCGSTVKYLKESFDKINIDYKKVDGILITHAHSDHIKQIHMFNMLDVYSPFAISGIDSWYQVIPGQIFKIKDLTILPLSLSHDTEITIGYVIFDGIETLVYMTDTGYVSNRNLACIAHANYYILESNHDPEMLMATKRPYHLKKRIAGDDGHLSNQQCGEVLSKCVNEDTKEIILAHISQEANTYQLAYETNREYLLSNGLLRDDLILKAIEQFEIYQGGSL